MPLCVYLVACCRGQQIEIAFVASTLIAVCHNKRIRRHQTSAAVARRGKGWFHGFKLQRVVNDLGEVLAFCLPLGNVDDCEPVLALAKELWGKLVGDKGYLSQDLFEQLLDQDLHLITIVRKNMSNWLMLMMDRVLSRKHSIIETIND